MRIATMAFAPWRHTLMFASLFALVCGCDDDPVTTPSPVPVPIVRDVWIGTYDDRNATEHGALLFDSSRMGGEVWGVIVLRSRAAPDPGVGLYVRGTTRGDSTFLGLDPTYYPSGSGLALRAHSDHKQLSGTLVYTPSSIDATIDCASADIDSLDILSSFTVDRSVRGVAFDAARLWVSTLEDFRRFDLNGVLQDSVRVLYRPETYWTSDALASDGTRMWGHLPVTADSAGMLYSRSTLVEFSLEGVITRRFDVLHRINGLAHDGTSLWSLLLDSSALLRLDESGVVQERIPILPSDLVDIASDGQHFWGISWFLPLLYEIDATGAVVRVFDLPTAPGVQFRVGLTFDGTALWYASGGLGGESRLYRLRPRSR